MLQDAYTFGKRINQWLSQFGTVYRGVLPTNATPDNIYLQVSGYYDNFATSFIYPVQIYKLNTTSYTEVVKVAQNIEREIGDGGTLVIYDDIRFKIDKGSPFYQDKTDESETIRAGYINLEITIY